MHLMGEIVGGPEQLRILRVVAAYDVVMKDPVDPYPNKGKDHMYPLARLRGEATRAMGTVNEALRNIVDPRGVKKVLEGTKLQHSPAIADEEE